MLEAEGCWFSLSSVERRRREEESAGINCMHVYLMGRTRIKREVKALIKEKLIQESNTMFFSVTDVMVDVNQRNSTI